MDRLFFTFGWGIFVLITFGLISYRLWTPIEKKMDPNFKERMLIAFWPTLGWLEETVGTEELKRDLVRYRMAWFTWVMVCFVVLPLFGNYLFPKPPPPPLPPSLQQYILEHPPAK